SIHPKNIARLPLNRPSRERMLASSETSKAAPRSSNDMQLHSSNRFFRRPAERLIRSAELHIGLRDFDDDILIAAPKLRLKLDRNFEIWTVLADKCFS